MAQHFLLSSKARSLSIMNIVKMSDMKPLKCLKLLDGVRQMEMLFVLVW